MLAFQGKYEDAEPLYERATETLEKALGGDHPTVATALSSRADLLRAQVQGFFLDVSLWAVQSTCR